MEIFLRTVTYVTSQSVGLARLASLRLFHRWTAEKAEVGIGKPHGARGGPPQGGGELEE